MSGPSRYRDHEPPVVARPAAVCSPVPSPADRSEQGGTVPVLAHNQRRASSTLAPAPDTPTAGVTESGAARQVPDRRGHVGPSPSSPSPAGAGQPAGPGFFPFGGEVEDDGCWTYFASPGV